MNYNRKQFYSIIIALFSLLQIELSKSADTITPAWWTERGVIITGQAVEDYSAINIGQAKNMAYGAYLELDDKLAFIGGAGSDIENLVISWTLASPGRDDYAAMNIGMLKTIATPFYDRLKAVGYNGPPLDEQANSNDYPWTSTTTDDEDYSIVNAGMLKYVFSFDLLVDKNTVDEDEDGLTDVWEQQIINAAQNDLDPSNDHIKSIDDLDPQGDFDGDGMTNLNEYLNGTDATDYYNGQTPLIAIVGGDHQRGATGVRLLDPLVLVVRDQYAQPLVNAPVLLMPESIDALLGTIADGSDLRTPIVVRTDTDGQATIYIQL